MTMTWTRFRVAVVIISLITVVGCDEDIEVVYYEAVPPQTTYIIEDCDCDCLFCW